MKKILLAALVASVMSTSAMATWYDGTLGEIRQFPSFTKVVLIEADGTMLTKTISGDLEVQKRILAMLLTAKASGMQVSLADTADGLGWNGVILK